MVIFETGGLGDHPSAFRASVDQGVDIFMRPNPRIDGDTYFEGL